MESSQVFVKGMGLVGLEPTSFSAKDFRNAIAFATTYRVLRSGLSLYRAAYRSLGSNRLVSTHAR